MREVERIPNLNSIGTYLDRIAVECVKQAQFETKLEEYGYGDKGELQKKVNLQQSIRNAWRKKFTDEMVRIWVTGDYECILETRTFV